MKILRRGIGRRTSLFPVISSSIWLSATTGALLLSAGCSATQAHESDPAQPAAPAAESSPALSAVRYQQEAESIADVVETVLPSVVSVKSTKLAKQPSRQQFLFGGPRSGRPSQGLGSGVILSEKGLVVTNNHVIEGADTVEVQLNDDRQFKAKVVGADPKSDVAVLQLLGDDVRDLQPVRVGDSAALRLGEVVLAVGNPFGVGQTVTMGIVSATGRSDMGIVDYENFIQTDAAINPGNSGGALINMRGELVGINTAILSRSGGSMGIGFAIPTNMAAPIVESLKTKGSVSRGWLGVRIQELDADLKDALQMGDQDGVLIADVAADGPAEAAGLLSGDVVTHVGKSPVSSTGQFRNLIASAGGESSTTLQVVRGGKKKSLKVELGTLPGDDEEAEFKPKGEDSGSEVKGLALRDLDDQLRRRLRVPKGIKGAVIMRIVPGSEEERANLRPGDVILEVNRKPVSTAKEAREAYGAATGSKLIQVLRRGTRQYIVVK